MNKTIIYILVGTALIGGSIWAFIYFRNRNKDNSDIDSDSDDDKKPSNDKKPSSEKDGDIKIISNYQKSVGIKPNESKLREKGADFLEKWANAIEKKTQRGGFLYKNRLYTLRKGEKSIINPIDKSVFTTLLLSEYKPSMSVPSIRGIGFAGGKAGVVRDYRFDSDGDLWLYAKTLTGIGSMWWLSTSVTTGTLGTQKFSFSGEVDDYGL